MKFDLLGFLAFPTERPHFAIPLFRSSDGDEVYSQEIGSDGLISSFKSVYVEELQEYFIENTFGFECDLETGVVARYAYFISASECYFGERSLVENRISNNISKISVSATAHLQALRFIGCSREEEVQAIHRLSEIFTNPEIKSRFLSFEKSTLTKSDSELLLVELITKLSNSGNFATTHELISLLVKEKSKFTYEHFRMAIRACLSNDQVHWISKDSDVKEFIDFLLGDGRIKLTEEQLSKLHR